MAEESRVGLGEKQTEQDDTDDQSKRIQGNEDAPGQIRFVDRFLYQCIPTAAEGPFQGSLGFCLIHARIVD